MSNKKISTIHLFLRAPLVFLVIGCMLLFSGLMQLFFPTTVSELETFPATILSGTLLIALGLFLFFYRRKRFLSGVSHQKAKDTVPASATATHLNADRSENTIKTDLSSQVIQVRADDAAIQDVPSIQESATNTAVHAAPHITVPKRVGNQILLYYYHKVRFRPNENAQTIAEQIAASSKFELSIAMDDNRAVLSSCTGCLGTLMDRTNMVRDWLSRGDLVRVWLEHCGDHENVVFLAFYRDEEKRLSDHECSASIKLIRYQNQDAQFNMLGLDPGDKLSFEEDIDHNGNEIVWVADGGAIGALPKTYAQRYLSEGASAVFLDHIEEDVENFKSIPFVKIYW